MRDIFTRQNIEDRETRYLPVENKETVEGNKLCDLLK